MAKKEKQECPNCGKKVQRLGQHLLYCQKNEKENEPVKAEPPVVDTSKITLRFRQSIWVKINGKTYEGTQIELDNITTASEIVRIAKEAYGWDVLI